MSKPKNAKRAKKPPLYVRELRKLMGRVVPRGDPFCSNWAWQATGVHHARIDATIERAHRLGYIEPAIRIPGRFGYTGRFSRRLTGWWQATDAGKQWERKAHATK